MVKAIYVVRCRTPRTGWECDFFGNIDTATEELHIQARALGPQNVFFGGYVLADGPEGLAMWLNAQLRGEEVLPCPTT